MAKRTAKGTRTEPEAWVEAEPRAVRFEELAGHGGALKVLRRALEAGALPQAVILSGPEGVGKHTLAVMAAAALQCEAGRDGACGTCGPCRKVARRLHPDVREVGLEASDTSGKQRTQIVLAQIQAAILEPLSLAPYEGRRLVFIVDPAEAMNPSVQNALLKPLEEPPPYAQFFLVTANPSGLLPTIRSRCQEMVLHPVSTETLAAFARSRGMGADAGSLAAAGGCPGRLADASAEETLALRAVLLALMTAGLDSGSYPDLAPGLEALAKKPPRQVLSLATGMLRDTIRVGGGSPPLIHADAEGPLRAAAEARGSEGLTLLGDRLAEAPSLLARNANARLLWERIYLT